MTIEYNDADGHEQFSSAFLDLRDNFALGILQARQVTSNAVSSGGSSGNSCEAHIFSARVSAPRSRLL